MSSENQAFHLMMVPALERLKGRSPEDISERAGVGFDRNSGAFTVRTLDQVVTVDFPSYALHQKLPDWHHLLLLHYLEMADGAACDLQPIAFGDLKNGVVRGVKFDRYAERQLIDILKDKTPDRIQTICTEMGGEFVSSKADLCVRFWLFPRYPLIMNVWFADDEFPAAGKLLLSRSADHFLDIEDAVTAGEVILQRLKEG